VSRFQFVANHQDTFEVKRLCALVEVERSSFALFAGLSNLLCKQG
jgi:hypothetical protein